MSSPFALTPAADPSREHLAALEARVAERERALSALKLELQDLQARYLAEVGVLCGERDAIEDAIADEEVRRGLRPAASWDATRADDTARGTGSPDPAACDECINRAVPSVDLKRIFRDVAKAIHPDRARDDAARYRRHSLMAEANRAYAERDEDRLRLILRAWEGRHDLLPDDQPGDSRERRRRRATAFEVRLVEIDAEFADLRSSAIGRLKQRIDDTRAQGWDLFAEMMREVKREIARASARLAILRRAPGRPDP